MTTSEIETYLSKITDEIHGYESWESDGYKGYKITGSDLNVVSPLSAGLVHRGYAVCKTKPTEIVIRKIKLKDGSIYLER